MSMMQALGRHYTIMRRTSNLEKQPWRRHAGNEIPPHRYVKAMASENP